MSYLEAARRHAILNARRYGRANWKAVLGKLMGEHPELRGRGREVVEEVRRVVEEVNALSREEIEREAERLGAPERRRKREAGLPELPGDTSRVVMRFAPNPSGPLHLGHARAAVLNHEYVRRYSGRLILRIEDTDPARVYPPAYEMIPQDLSWLGVEVHQVVVQSSRLDVYREHAEQLIRMGRAYVCFCDTERFRRLRGRGEPCEHRGQSVEENLREFGRMFSELGEGEAVLRLKTGMELRDPAMRDFPIMRISEVPHPRVDARVYPLMNFSVAVDDHLLGVTHVLRGKDHIVNTRKQEFIYRFFGWEMPEFIHYGRMKIEGVRLSTSEIRRGIEAGEYSGWDDVRLGTLRALARRGFMPEAVRRAVLEAGVKQSDISFSWKVLYAHNRQLVEPVADRYFFVASPARLVVEGIESFRARVRLHPDHPERGYRELVLSGTGGRAEVFIDRRDLERLEEGQVVRLMEGFNVLLRRAGDGEGVAEFHSRELEEAKRHGARLIHWVPAGEHVEVEVLRPEGRDTGVGEAALRSVEPGRVVQFERYGFVRIDSKDEAIVACYAHP